MWKSRQDGDPLLLHLFRENAAVDEQDIPVSIETDFIFAANLTQTAEAARDTIRYGGTSAGRSASSLGPGADPRRGNATTVQRAGIKGAPRASHRAGCGWGRKPSPDVVFLGQRQAGRQRCT